MCESGLRDKSFGWRPTTSLRGRTARPGQPRREGGTRRNGRRRGQALPERRQRTGDLPAELHATMTIQSFRPARRWCGACARAPSGWLPLSPPARRSEQSPHSSGRRAPPEQETYQRVRHYARTRHRRQVVFTAPRSSTSSARGRGTWHARRRSRIDLVPCPRCALSRHHRAWRAAAAAALSVVDGAGHRPAEATWSELAGKPLGRARARLLSRAASFVALQLGGPAGAARLSVCPTSESSAFTPRSQPRHLPAGRGGRAAG